MLDNARQNANGTTHVCDEEDALSWLLLLKVVKSWGTDQLSWLNVTQCASNVAQGGFF